MMQVQMMKLYSTPAGEYTIAQRIQKPYHNSLTPLTTSSFKTVKRVIKEGKGQLPNVAIVKNKVPNK